MKLTKLQPTDKRNRKLFNSSQSYFHYLFNICWKTSFVGKRSGWLKDFRALHSLNYFGVNKFSNILGQVSFMKAFSITF